MRRVVVTGMGMITTLGCGVKDNWKNLISNTSGIKLIDSFKTDDLPSKVGGTISDDIISKLLDLNIMIFIFNTKFLHVILRVHLIEVNVHFRIYFNL